MQKTAKAVAPTCTAFSGLFCTAFQPGTLIEPATISVTRRVLPERKEHDCGPSQPFSCHRDVTDRFVTNATSKRQHLQRIVFCKTGKERKIGPIWVFRGLLAFGPGPPLAFDMVDVIARMA